MSDAVEGVLSESGDDWGSSVNEIEQVPVVAIGHDPRRLQPNKPRVAWLVVSLIAAAVVGFVFLRYYWFLATFELFDCVNVINDAPDPPEHLEGGQDSSVYVAALVSVVAWLGAWKITAATPLRRWPALVVLVFAVLEVAALSALWFLAPAIWGPEHCVPD